MIRAFQTNRLTRPARVRLSINKRCIISRSSNGKKDAFAPGSLMKRLEAEDSKHAAELAEEYKKEGIDVRGMSLLKIWLTIVPKSSGRLPSLMNRSSFGPSWRDQIKEMEAGPSGPALAPEPSRKGKEKAIEPEVGQSLADSSLCDTNRLLIIQYHPVFDVIPLVYSYCHPHSTLSCSLVHLCLSLQRLYSKSRSDISTSMVSCPKQLLCWTSYHSICQLYMGPTYETTSKR